MATPLRLARKKHPEKKIQYKESHHTLRLEKEVWNKWQLYKSASCHRTHDQFASALLNLWINQKDTRESQCPPHTNLQGPAPSLMSNPSPSEIQNTRTKTIKDDETSSVDSSARYQLNHTSEYSENVVIKTEPLDTFCKDQSERMESVHLMMDCESVIDNDASLMHSGKGEVIKESDEMEPVRLMMDCESDIDNDTVCSVKREVIKEGDEYLVNHTYVDNVNVMTQTEYETTFNENESKRPEPLLMDCESVVDDDISLVYQQNGIVTLSNRPLGERGVSGILNDKNDAIMKQEEKIPNNVCKETKEGEESRTRVKRKSSGSLSVLRQKMIKFEERSGENIPRSSRIRSKGYRINYAELDELQPPSDLSDDVKSELEYMLDDSSTDDASELDDFPDVEENSDSETKPKPKEKTKDPDFFPVSDNESLQDSEWDSFQESDTRIDSEGDIPNSPVRKKKSNDDLTAEERQLKKQRRQKHRITVILSEHTDMYYFEDHVSIEMKDRSKADAEKSFQLMVCGQCHKFRTEDKKQMETHLENHINGDFSCPKCDFQASSTFEMSQHKRVNHSKTQRCRLCSTPEHTVEIKIQEFREHYMQNHKDHLRQCSLCGKHYLKKDSHRCKKISNPVVQCDMCGKEMKKNNLTTHRRRVHFNVRAYPCSLCKYSAKSGCALKRHMQAKHEGVCEFKCDQCDFTCVRPFQLTSHKRTHTGVKPYTCDKCPYAAAWNVQLKEHRKLHEGLSALGKPCEICSIVVREGAPYTKHLRKEHGQDV